MSKPAARIVERTRTTHISAQDAMQSGLGYSAGSITNTYLEAELVYGVPPPQVGTPLYAIDASTRLALKEAVEKFTESAEEWDALAKGMLDESARNHAIRGAAEDRHTAAVLKRLAGEGE